MAETTIRFGRKYMSFANGCMVINSTSITERALIGEDEEAFVHRLMKKYGDGEGTIEIVFKAGKPDYAIITLVP